MNSGYCPHCGRGARDDLYEDVRLSVIMPVFNERETVETILEAVKAVEIPKEIIIVDDGSTDGTQDRLRELAAGQGDENDGFDNRIRLVFHDENRGKGAAIRTAVPEVEGDIVVIQDADLEYDPNDYYRLLFPIVTDRADVVYGSRFMGGFAHRVLYFWHYLGNRTITFLSNMFTNLNLTDVETCYKAFRADIIKGLDLQEDSFGFEVEVTSKIARLGCRVYEVGVSYFGRTYEEGKKITWRDGVRAIYLILKYR